MLPELAKEVIRSGRLAHLVTLDPDGSPHVTLAWVGIDGENIAIGTLMDQKKLKNMRRDPRVAISIDTLEKNEIGLDKFAVFYGRATVVEGGAPELLQALAYTYIGPGVRFPPFPNPPPGYVTRIAVDRVGGIGPWTSG